MMKSESVKSLVSSGKLVQCGFDYFDVQSGVMIRRVRVYGRRGHGVDKWHRDGDDVLYRSLLEAYYHA